MEIAQLQRLRARAHVHTEKCRAHPATRAPYGLIEESDPRFICGKREDADLAVLLAAYDELVATSDAANRILRDANARAFGEDTDGDII